MVRVLAIATCALALTAALVTGASARGGNHGCDVATGSFYSSHFHESGDNIVAGFHVNTPEFGSPTDAVTLRNTATEGGAFSGLGCGWDPGTWKLFESELGPGDDSLRMDAKGLDDLDPTPGPLPASIKAKIQGGLGADKIRGHVGRDLIEGNEGPDVITLYKGRDEGSGGPGADLIRARNRDRDKVNCGPGKDRAIVDPRDDVTGCETVRVKV